MKRLIILSAFALMSCNEGNPAVIKQGRDVQVWVDPDTGCKYLLYSEWPMTNAAVGSLSIRFRRDGKPDCPGSEVAE